MKKLVKRSDVMQETLEAYCSCSCSCYGTCSCSTGQTNNSAALFQARYTQFYMDLDCQHFFRQIFLGYFSDIVQAFDTLRKNVCGDDYTSLHNPIVLSSVLPAYGMFHSIQILFL
mgnify:CR=1 FL=1